MTTPPGRTPQDRSAWATTADIAIIPEPGQLAFTCDCGQAPCRHTAALGHALTRAHDLPRTLIAMRGLTHQRLKTLLHARAAATTTPTATPTATPAAPPADRPDRPQPSFVLAHHAFQTHPDNPGRTTEPAPTAAPEPAPPGTGENNGTPLTAPATDEPPAPAPSLTELDHLITHAAQTATRLLTDDTPPPCDPVTDALALASTLPPALRRPAETAARLDLNLAAYHALIAAHTPARPTTTTTATATTTATTTAPQE